MLYGAIACVFVIVFLAEEIFVFRRFVNGIARKKQSFTTRVETLHKELESIKQNMEDFDARIAEHFFFYDLTRKIAPTLEIDELCKIFSEEIKYLGDVESVTYSKPFDAEGYLQFPLDEENLLGLFVKTKSKKVTEYLPSLAKLLRLCVEKVHLYHASQQLSIYDSLTECYNRRYFMNRFFDEFERAKKFNHHISFLMVDIDHFKKINDTYGHLVGDAVLKTIAGLIQENIREIDFLARYGGEEFAIILPETDKAGAIMVADRICGKVSQERLKAFDEMVTTTISVGVASFPQNTLYADVLMETADKALYKAKVSGRNRVSWF
ncbi:MAG: GGDEF domain-containing protein [Candidatus Omnitrophota bacterium]